MENYTNTYYDINDINNLKYYVFNQSPLVRNDDMIKIIKNVDEAFVFNTILYSIDTAINMHGITTSNFDIYYLLLQSNKKYSFDKSYSSKIC